MFLHTFDLANTRNWQISTGKLSGFELKIDYIALINLSTDITFIHIWKHLDLSMSVDVNTYNNNSHTWKLGFQIVINQRAFFPPSRGCRGVQCAPQHCRSGALLACSHNLKYNVWNCNCNLVAQERLFQCGFWHLGPQNTFSGFYRPQNGISLRSGLLSSLLVILISAIYHNIVYTSTRL